VVATLGARVNSSGYQCDDIKALRRMCDVHSMSLILEGSCMLLCAIPEAGVWFKTAFECADAVVLQPLTWLRHGSSPSLAITLSKSSLSVDAHEGLTGMSNTVALWHQLVSTNLLQLNARIEMHLRLCKALEYELRNDSKVFTVDQGPGPRQPHISLFRIRPVGGLNLAEFNMDVPTLQEWLFEQHISKSDSQAHFSLIELNDTTGILFRPVQSPDNGCTEKSVKDAVAAIRGAMQSLHLALAAREKLQTEIKAFPNLDILDSRIVNGCVGVGAIKYLPDYEIPEDVTDTLNHTLARLLQTKKPDSYVLSFCRGSLGEDEKGLDSHESSDSLAADAHEGACIVLKPSVGSSDMKLVLQEIIDTAKSMELPEEVLNALSKSIARGIQEAEKKIEIHNTAVYHPITLARKAPLLGTVLEWVFPPAEKVEPAFGHTFNMSKSTSNLKQALEETQKEDEELLE